MASCSTTGRCVAPAQQRGCRTAAGQRSDTASETPRRAMLPLVVLAASVFVVAAPALLPEPALAFGQGFPGYDMDLAGRKRAFDRNKREMAIEVEKAAATRAARVAARAALKAAPPVAVPVVQEAAAPVAAAAASE